MSHTQERIPTLSAKFTGQSDFAGYCNAAEAMLEYYEAMDIVDGTKTKPKDEPEPVSGSLKEAQEKEQTEWDEMN